MQIDVIFSASEVDATRIKDKAVVVIDVLRATSVMVTALWNGASKVVPVLSPEEAFEYRERFTDEEVVLAGERHSEKISGFDYGNSPLDMQRQNIGGKTLVMTTTNGTLAVRRSSESSELFVTAFLNAGATARALEGFEDVVLVCSGSNGGFTMEDTLCAGYLLELINRQEASVRMTDAAVASYRLYIAEKNDIHQIAGEGRHYNLLRGKGLSMDLRYCFQKNENQMVCRRRRDAIYGEGPELFGI
ncbi:MAG: 2-phosphosulfolactate phosphatase [Marinilabilia sp.]